MWNHWRILIEKEWRYLKLPCHCNCQRAKPCKTCQTPDPRCELMDLRNPQSFNLCDCLRVKKAENPEECPPCALFEVEHPLWPESSCPKSPPCFVTLTPVSTFGALLHRRRASSSLAHTTSHNRSAQKNWQPPNVYAFLRPSNFKNPLRLAVSRKTKQKPPNPQKLRNSTNLEQVDPKGETSPNLCITVAKPTEMCAPKPSQTPIGSNSKRPQKNLQDSTLDQPNYTMMKRSPCAEWRRDATLNHSNPRSWRDTSQ